MKINSTSLTLLLVSCFGVLSVTAQDEHFIYGRITLEDSKVYEGPIRWGKEEVYWNDIFNAAKERNDNLKFLSSKERDDLHERQYHHNGEWGGRLASTFGWNWNDDNDHSDRSDFTHQFACQFGEIKSMTPQGSKWVDIELRNGSKLSLNGEGYNDVGLDIKVLDKELGEVQLYWNRIEKIDFINTPTRLANSFGKPLYGTVESFGEKFIGFIQWDHDERLSSDKLDGDSDDGDLSIEFDKIRSIEKLNSNRSKVTLKSGRELYLEDSNDVGRGHRGVIVMNKDFTAVDVPWTEFDKITFEDKTPGAFVSYDQFKNQKELSATVKTFGGQSYSGRLIFDLDEEYDFELLQGKQRDFEYITAFRNIKKIKTYDDTRCEIELRTGTKLMLMDGQDVNDRNHGILVFEQGKSEPQYISWEKVSEIEFR